MKETIATGEKYLLTIKEAGDYFNIVVKKMRRLAEDNIGGSSIYNGNSHLVIRQKFEEHLLEMAVKGVDTSDETEPD